VAGDLKMLINEKFFTEVGSYIEKHMEENIDIESLTRNFYISRKQFYRGFKKFLGISPFEFVQRKKIEAAKGMLEEGLLSMCEISLAIGYSNQSSFTRAFKKHMGKLPKEFRGLSQK
jgi:AraC-like DNA-binding protein